jgi:hypothetical protein
VRKIACEAPQFGRASGDFAHAASIPDAMIGHVTVSAQTSKVGRSFSPHGYVTTVCVRLCSWFYRCVKNALLPADRPTGVATDRDRMSLRGISQKADGVRKISLTTHDVAVAPRRAILPTLPLANFLARAEGSSQTPRDGEHLRPKALRLDPA